MSAPKTTEMSIGIVPFIIFALFLFVPFLNFDITYYRMTLKLFVFQTGTAVALCYLLWEWATGRLRGPGLPSYWVILPAAAWVGWGALTALWSPHGWLATGWVVQGLSGAAGAFALAVLLRERGPRHVFVAAASAVALTLGLFMAALYGVPHATFFGDRDLVGRQAGAAFLLLPTLAAAAMLYGHGDEKDDESYKGVLWLTAVLLVLLVAGLRAESYEWLMALGAGLGVLIWLMLRRLRLVALVVFALVAVVAAQREVKVRAAAADFLTARPLAYYALFDGLDGRVVRGAGLAQFVFGRGVGTYPLDLDAVRTPASFATPRGNIIETHARRLLTEVLCERGLVGLGLAAAMGVACVAAGVLAQRRARSRLDAALGPGLAAGVVAMGVFACFSNGGAGFGAGMVFWVALGLLGALSVETGRAAGLALSPAEQAGAGETAPAAPPHRAIVAVLGGSGAVVLWFFLGARPFWAEWCVREGQSEHETTMSLAAQRSLAAQVLADIKAKANPKAPESEEAVRAAEEGLRTATAACEDSVRRTRDYLRRAAALSLGDRVWLNSLSILAECEIAQGDFQDAAKQCRRLVAACGHAFTLDFFLADCEAYTGHPDKANALYWRYAQRDPFAVKSALYPTRRDVYSHWLATILGERQKRNAVWLSWAQDLSETAAAGPRIDPNRYMLLMARGFVESLKGDDAETRRIMKRATEIIAVELTKPYPPPVEAELRVEMARAYSYLDHAKAIEYAKSLAQLNLDFRDPALRPVLETAATIIKDLEARKKKEPKPSAASPLAPKPRKY